MTAISSVLDRLTHVTPTPNGWSARCPCHEDRKNSLCITEKDGRVLLCCQAKCETAAIVDAIGLKWSDLFADHEPAARSGTKGGRIVARYDYRDRTGMLLYQAVRFEPKDFRQRTPKPGGGWEWKLNGTPRVLYQLPELIEADPGAPVFVVEGEKDVDQLWHLGLVATCNVGGAGKWRDEYNEPLRGRHVVLVPDNDEPGRKHVEQVAKSLDGTASSIRVLTLDGLPSKGDVSDWLDAGHDATELRKLANGAPVWQPSREQSGVVNSPSTAGGAAELPLTDLGNARRLVAAHGRDIRFCHPWGKWLVWDGTRWRIDDSGEIVRRAKSVVDGMIIAIPSVREIEREPFAKHALASGRGSRIAAMVSLAQSEPGIPVLPDDLDQDPWLLNCPNGTVDLRTGNLREARREDLLTKVTRANYDPEAGSYAWDRFLESIFGGNGDLIGFVQRFLGYALTGSVREHVLAVLYGVGANGKSTLLETFMHAAGPDYASKAAPDLLLVRHGQSHPTERADLYGKRFITAVETQDGQRLHESMVKELTGGDTVKARRMREDFWTFAPTWKIALCTNCKPTIRGTDHGIWRRIRLIPFVRVFDGTDQDKNLPEKLRAEAEGVLAWAVRGCLEWQRSGLGEPAAIVEATNAYRTEQDIVGQFLADRCTVAEGATVRAKELRTALDEWATDAGQNVPSPKRLGNELASRGFERFTNNGTVYRGLALR